MRGERGGDDGAIPPRLYLEVLTLFTQNAAKKSKMKRPAKLILIFYCRVLSEAIYFDKVSTNISSL